MNPKGAGYERFIRIDLFNRSDVELREMMNCYGLRKYIAKRVFGKTTEDHVDAVFRTLEKILVEKIDMREGYDPIALGA